MINYQQTKCESFNEINLMFDQKMITFCYLKRIFIIANLPFLFVKNLFNIQNKAAIRNIL